MKKIGNWWATDNTAIVEGMILKEEFTCLPTLEKAFSYVTKFENAIDIGTWIGDSTVPISKKFKNVLAFEANPEVYSCCVKNIEDRDITNCEIKNVAISNSNAQKTFFNGKSNFSGWVSDKEDLEITITNKLIVNTITLDSLNLKNIDFIKIDVDSHEGYLLEGAIEFLRNNSPVILIENKVRIHKERQPIDMPDPVKILNSLGYRMVDHVAKADYVYIKDCL